MDAREYGLPDGVACPFCEGAETELHSPFGTALSVATYWCRRCRTPFEWVKWGPVQAEATEAPEGTEGTEGKEDAENSS